MSRGVNSVELPHMLIASEATIGQTSVVHMQTARAPPSKQPFVNLNFNFDFNCDTNHNTTDSPKSTHQGHSDKTITMAKKKATQPSLSKRLGIAYMSNRQSRLLSLPAELRISIWEYVCAGIEFDINVNARKCANSRKHKIGILGVCKQIRKEVTPICLGLTVFKWKEGLLVQRGEELLAGLALEHAGKIRRFCIVPRFGEISEDAGYRQTDVVDWEITQSSGCMRLGLEGLGIMKIDVELELRLPNGKLVQTNDPKSLLMEQ